MLSSLTGPVRGVPVAGPSGRGQTQLFSSPVWTHVATLSHTPSLSKCGHHHRQRLVAARAEPLTFDISKYGNKAVLDQAARRYALGEGGTLPLCVCGKVHVLACTWAGNTSVVDGSVFDTGVMGALFSSVSRQSVLDVCTCVHAPAPDLLSGGAMATRVVVVVTKTHKIEGGPLAGGRQNLP